MASDFYPASHLKRPRATRDEMKQRHRALFNIVSEMRPMTVRQVFYQATVRGIVEKSEAGYRKVQTDLADMRRSGALPFNWIADNTRWQRRPQTFRDVAQALTDTARFYRKSLWRHANSYVEIWLEKDALSGVVHPVTSMYDTPLMVARGYASLSFLHSSAEHISRLAVPTYVYHLGDFDPSGVNAGEKIEQTLRELAPNAELYFERIAVNADQITRWNLPSRPTKKSDSRSKKFGDVSVELDAISPTDLRNIVETAIQKHLPPAQFDILRAAEESERTLLNSLVEGLLADG